MGRVTRKKAAELAESLHIDEDVVLDLSGDEAALTKAKAGTANPTDRPPLGELAPNSADSNNHSEDGAQELKKSTRGKKGAKKGAAKSKKNNLAASTASQPADDPQDEVLPDDNDSAPSPASEKAAEDLMKDVPECECRGIAICSSRSHDANAGGSAVSISHAIEDTTRPRSPPSPAVKLTRSQLKGTDNIEESEPKVLLDGLDQEQTMKEETVRDIPVINSSESDPVNGNSEAAVPVNAPASPLPSAMPNVVSNLRVDTPAKRSTSNKENVEPAADDMESSNPAYDELEEAAVSAATPPRDDRSERESSVRPEDHIAALDELDEAVETISKDIPEVQTSPEKPKAKKDGSKKAAPVVRTTKAAAARISMAHGPKDTPKGPALGRPSPQKALGRSNSTRVTSNSSNRVVSSSSAKDGSPSTVAEKKDVVIPHSKARPISMSFPTPPPPPKSTKAPTQSTFKLPGEAVAEKLKAAKEARLAREAEEEKKKAFKARPVPSSLSKAPSVRQTNSSKARESLMNGKPLSSAPKPAPAHQRANSVATTRPTAPKPRVPSTSTETRKPLSSSSSSRPPLHAPRKRPSTAMADMTKPNPRASLATSNGISGLARIPSGQSKGTAKGKEVFNRAAAAKAAADKEKADKEEATKRARAEAAERSKQAARAFAEKQKKKQLAAKQATQKAEEEAAVETAPVAY